MLPALREVLAKTTPWCLVALLAWGCGGAPGIESKGSPDAAVPRQQEAGGGSRPTTGGAGVVADGVCYALCVDGSTDPDANGVRDGWGFENGASCVVPDSLEARTRSSCVVGMPISQPTVGPPANSPGVVINGGCVGLCRATTIADDTDNDGYGWELDASCVIPGSATAMISISCRTGAPAPQPDFTGLPGRLLNEVCIPYCHSGVSTDLDGDGFGYEFGMPCVVKGSTPATTTGIDCTVGQDILVPPAVLNPSPRVGPGQKPQEAQSRGFYVAGGRLYDKFGNDFVMRGINNPHIYFDGANQYFAYQALDAIARYGSNSVRIVWKTTGSPSNLARVVRRVVELHMIPMVELHDVTGGTTNQGLLAMASYYARDDVKAVLASYEDFLLVNIANEWSGLDFRSAYQAAVSQLRAAGIHHTLVIDSNNFGQNANTIMTEGPLLLAADPEHNLLFSLHMYQEYPATAAGQALVTSTFQRAVSAGLPLVVGEFGGQAGGSPVAFQLIMSECARLGLGYLAWSWKGNDPSLAYLDMAVDWQGQSLTDWGNNILKAPNGISAATPRASVFAP